MSLAQRTRVVVQTMVEQRTTVVEQMMAQRKMAVEQTMEQRKMVVEQMRVVGQTMVAKRTMAVERTMVRRKTVDPNMALALGTMVVEHRTSCLVDTLEDCFRQMSFRRTSCCRMSLHQMSRRRTMAAELEEELRRQTKPTRIVMGRVVVELRMS